MTPARVAALFACVTAWLWLWSIHTPWAADLAPRLWLYDILYYARVLLVAWLLTEVALWCWHPSKRRQLASLLLGGTVLAGIAGWAYAQTGMGWRLRVLASASALDAVATGGASNLRQRAGQVLVDTVRFPCSASAPWFWLGRPHGAGSGINLALVRSDSAPQAPYAEAFRIRRIDGRCGWLTSTALATTPCRRTPRRLPAWCRRWRPRIAPGCASSRAADPREPAVPAPSSTMATIARGKLRPLLSP